MRRSLTGTLAFAALCAGFIPQPAWCSAGAAPPPGIGAPAGDEVVVRGKALEKLRIQIKLAENDVYARFNDINSSDLYDIHCYQRPRIGSRIEQRICLSNAWRAYDAAIAESTVRAMQGSGPENSGSVSGDTGIAQASRANQLATERRVVNELGQLAHSDPALGAAMIRLGQAYQAEELLSGSGPVWTLYREVDPGEKGLPADAKHLFEVRVGQVAWSHPLTSRAFTIAGVRGQIRRMRVDCEQAHKKLEYEDDVDWTIPDAWGPCTLHVDAKRDTTFALYEFQ
jgi:hypothetical protein